MSSESLPNNSSNQNLSCHFCEERLPTLDDMRNHLVRCATKTNQCPNCKKYIQRSIYAYHIDNNCTNPDLSDEEPKVILLNSINQRIDQVETETPKKFEPLFKKATQTHETLAEICYRSEIDHVAGKLQFNTVIMGSPRVGKSSLINILFGRDIAETSASLHPCTPEIKCYPLENDQQRNPTVQPFKINIWDTPGIESWDKQEGKMTMIQFIEEINPICVIYCASPGSAAKLDQLHSVLKYCQSKGIFCALVCTNMWADQKRHEVIKEFEKQLEFFGEKVDKFSDQMHTTTPHKITFFGKGALCTMVNSKEYYDPEFSDRRMPVQGVDELIHGIMEGLDEEKLLGWCYAVLYQRSYWEKISQKVEGFFELHSTHLYNLIALTHEQTATNFATHFLNQNLFKKTT